MKINKCIRLDDLFFEYLHSDEIVGSCEVIDDYRNELYSLVFYIDTNYNFLDVEELSINYAGKQEVLSSEHWDLSNLTDDQEDILNVIRQEAQQ